MNPTAWMRFPRRMMRGASIANLPVGNGCGETAARAGDGTSLDGMLAP